MPGSIGNALRLGMDMGDYGQRQAMNAEALKASKFQNALLPEERAYQVEQRGVQSQAAAIKAKQEKAKFGAEMIEKTVKRVGIDSYPRWRETAIKEWGVPERILPDPSIFMGEGGETKFTKSFKPALYQKSLEVQGKKEAAQIAAAAKANLPQSAIAKAKSDLAAGRIDRSEYDAVFRKQTNVPPPRKGMKVYGPDGNIIIDTGGNSADLSPKTIGDIEGKMINTSEGLSRISNIVKSFKPEFQEIPTKLGVAWSSLKSKLGSNIPQEESAKLQEFATYKQDSLENINLYIKEITGAQMSEKEADRLRKAQPDPGDGIFGGDDPISFKAKLVNTYKKLRMANIRQNHYLNQGLNKETLKQLIKSDSVVSIEQMEKILDERGSAYEKEIKKQNPNISAMDLFSQVKQRLAKEFNTEF